MLHFSLPCFLLITGEAHTKRVKQIHDFDLVFSGSDSESESSSESENMSDSESDSESEDHSEYKNRIESHGENEVNFMVKEPARTINISDTFDVRAESKSFHDVVSNVEHSVVVKERDVLSDSSGSDFSDSDDSESDESDESDDLSDSCSSRSDESEDEEDRITIRTTCHTSSYY